ncbi:hypothetical protein [Saccharopolyspora shandongensis]|uniref:hypothetical protein n=1 Tax=Saccharopolyspora shandongensis TaxID=418495 RepID=UPI00340D6812
MAFLRRIGFIETEEQERARLAQAPTGSISHYLSTLPITIKEWPQDLLVQLPWEPPRSGKQYTVVVVPLEYRKDPLPEGVDEKSLPRKLNPGSWRCAVVSSDHPSYPVGGHRIIVGTDEIARGNKVLIERPRPPRTPHHTPTNAGPGTAWTAPGIPPPPSSPPATEPSHATTGRRAQPVRYLLVWGAVVLGVLLAVAGLAILLASTVLEPPAGTGHDLSLRADHALGIWPS